MRNKKKKPFNNSTNELLKGSKCVIKHPKQVNYNTFKAFRKELFFLRLFYVTKTKKREVKKEWNKKIIF